VISIPWTEEQVEALNGYQRAGVMHPFTCEYRSDHMFANAGILVATPTGWECPYQHCTYMQFWAHGFMFDPHWRECRGGIYHSMARIKGVSENDL
jgi:hypothetical protein